MPYSEDFLQLMGKLYASTEAKHAVFQASAIELVDSQASAKSGVSAKPKPNKAVAATQTSDCYERTQRSLLYQAESNRALNVQLQKTREELKRCKNQIKLAEFQNLTLSNEARLQEQQNQKLRDYLTNMRVSRGLEREIQLNSRQMLTFEGQELRMIRSQLADLRKQLLGSDIMEHAIYRFALYRDSVYYQNTLQCFQLYEAQAQLLYQQERNTALAAENERVVDQADMLYNSCRQLRNTQSALSSDNEKLSSEMSICKQLIATYKQALTSKEREISNLGYSLANQQEQLYKSYKMLYDSAKLYNEHDSACEMNVEQISITASRSGTLVLRKAGKHNSDYETQTEECDDLLYQAEEKAAVLGVELYQEKQASEHLICELERLSRQNAELELEKQSLKTESISFYKQASEAGVMRYQIENYVYQIETLKIELLQEKSVSQQREVLDEPPEEHQITQLLRIYNQKLVAYMQQMALRSAYRQYYLEEQIAAMQQQMMQKNAQMAYLRAQYAQPPAIYACSRSQSFSLELQAGPEALEIEQKDAEAQTELFIAENAYESGFASIIEWILAQIEHDTVGEALHTLLYRVEQLEGRFCKLRILLGQTQEENTQLAKYVEEQIHYNYALSEEIASLRDPFVCDTKRSPWGKKKALQSAPVQDQQKQVIELQNFIKELVYNLKMKTKEVEELTESALAYKNAALHKTLLERDRSIERLAGIVASVRAEACGVETVATRRLMQILK